MPKKPSAGGSSQMSRRPPRGVKAGKGKYLFKMVGLNSVEAGPDYSTAHGSVVEGERFMMGLLRMPKGTGAAAHNHPNEQWVYIIEGTLAFEVDGKKGIATPGSLLYFPPNAVHATQASADRDVVFLTGKDLSHGLWGNRIGKKPAVPAVKAKKRVRAR
jgi:quercetin dioxygenase-like cupin family protein